jgi:hypothetical protein
MLPVLPLLSSVRDSDPPVPPTVPVASILAPRLRYPMPTVGPISKRSLRKAAKR